MKADLVKKVQIFLEKYHMIKKDGHVLVGVSGGADSVCLLLVLSELKKTMGFSLAAVHVEHGIRGVESLADAEFTEKLCASLGVPFRMYSVDAPGYALRMHGSVEEAARELRYGCFVRACAEWKADTVAVAHHANDSAETMLFHLARGTGIRGLGGISPMVNYHVSEAVRDGIGVLSPAEDMCVIRPLLGVTRAEIEGYLTARGQVYRTDSTNADMTYTRNRIRGQILPELTEVNAQAVAHMGKTAGQLREICAYLDEMALREGANAYEVFYQELPLRADGGETKDSPIVKIQMYSEPFLAMHRVLQATLTHDLIGRIAGSEKDVTSGHVEQVLALFAMREGKQTDLPYGISAERFADGVKLYHRDNQRAEQRADGEEGSFDENDSGRAEICLDLPVPGELVFKNGAKICTKILEFDGNFEKIPKKRYTKWFDYDKIKGTVQLRTRRPGDYLQVNVDGGTKKLKRYFIDEKIAVKERERALLAVDGSHVLWVVGYRISEACKVTSKTRYVLCLDYQSPDTA